jgi:NAD(P)-dependent dehydrogenase (short-subunit alcohol dehydrogenase family)
MAKKDIFDLSGKVALITGGSSGLGRAFCEAMAEKGSNVAFSYNTNEPGARETEAMIAKYGIKTLLVKADTSKVEDIKSMFQKVERQFGKLDVLFNNAGMDVKFARTHEVPLEVWNRMITVNLTGTFVCMQEGLKIMLKQKKGSIINTASILGLVGSNPALVDSPAYVTTKHAIIGLTKQAACEYAADGIRVNAIAPGFFPSRIGRDTQLPEKKLQEMGEMQIKLTPLGRTGDLSELKGIAVYLASDASSFVTGSVSVVDGGVTIW